MPSDFSKLIDHLIVELCAINQRNDFCAYGKFSAQDQARYDELQARILQIREVYDLAHQVAPCPSCGEPRHASKGSVCWNIGRCQEAPYPGG